MKLDKEEMFPKKHRSKDLDIKILEKFSLRY